MSELLDDLQARGLVQDSTDLDALADRLDEGPLRLYYGCDPTCPASTSGNLIGLLVLRRFAEAGHRPVALVGGATGMVGDPGGRSEERNLLDDDTLAANVAGIRAQVESVVGRGGRRRRQPRPGPPSMTVLEFLRDVGKHVTVNQMLAKESIKARVESEHGISYTEFSYMLLQANDYWHLHATRGRRAADRRLRPVGQHRRRRRPDPPALPGHRACLHLAADDAGRRGQVRQVRRAAPSGSPPSGRRPTRSSSTG